MISVSAQEISKKLSITGNDHLIFPFKDYFCFSRHDIEPSTLMVLVFKNSFGFFFSVMEITILKQK